ncbi:cyclophilin-like fold protein [Dactylosporangium sp. NPDC000521]|uniref:cyclophilin-like fold protein n=1 Tax=Dactylosporangium sp. NPDC000521 TaxID=3363975 RepID=UPI0036C20909
MQRHLTHSAIAGLLLMLGGCAADPADNGQATPASQTATTPGSAAASGPVVGGRSGRPVEGTVVRFTTGAASVDVVIGRDTATVRDFLSLLPLELNLEEFAGKEKIAYLPRKLDTAGTPGVDPNAGDLVYYAPWGNLAFFYDADGVGYSDDTVHLGTFQATKQHLDQLASGRVTISVVS